MKLIWYLILFFYILFFSKKKSLFFFNVDQFSRHLFSIPYNDTCWFLNNVLLNYLVEAQYYFLQ